MSRVCLCAWLLAVHIGYLSAAPALAVVTRWNTNFSGNYNVAANWDNGLPDGDDNAVFARGAGVTYTVTFPGNSLVQPTAVYNSSLVLIDSNNVSFAQSTQLNLGNSRYVIGSYLLVADFFADVVLNTALNLLSTPRADIAFGPNAVGTVNVNAGTFSVTGSDNANHDFVIAQSGRGTVNVAPGAQLRLTGAEGNLALGANMGSIGTMNVSGAGSLVSQASLNPATPLVVGGRGSGLLNILGGGDVSDFAAVMGLESGSTGTVTVDGTGSTWTNGGSLTVGQAGVGSLTISGGGLVSDGEAFLGGAHGGLGTALVTGAGSRWSQASDLHVGVSLGTSNGVPQFGVGTLNVTNAGLVDTGGNAEIAALTSRATVSGAGSTWEVGGELSTQLGAVLDIKEGGVVNSSTAFVGSFNDGTAFVRDPDSTWNIADSLFVGRTGSGTLNVTGGGRVTSRLGFLGLRGAIFSTSSALVVIDGESTWDCSEQMFVGFEQPGMLAVGAGGQVTTGTGHVGFANGVNGRILVSGAGSNWTSNESLYVGVAGIGDLTVANGGTAVVDDLLSIGPRGTVQGNSTILAEVRNGGAVAPGVSPSFNLADALGTLRINGKYTQTAAGVLQIQLASPVSFDKLMLSGPAALGGAVEFQPILGYSPTIGDTFEFLTASGGVSGTFASTVLPPVLTTQPGAYWNLDYSSFRVILQLLAGVPGDYNHNGTVDAADYNVWRDSLGQIGTGLAADGDGDQVVDADDYQYWRDRFGNTFGSSAGSGLKVAASQDAVPEPAAVSLLMLAAAGWSLRRRRGCVESTNNSSTRDAGQQWTRYDTPGA